jgi:hypothetical protein
VNEDSQSIVHWKQMNVLHNSIFSDYHRSNSYKGKMAVVYTGAMHCGRGNAQGEHSSGL